MVTVVFVALACGGSDFDTAPYTDAVAGRFDDGEIMDSVHARCVADGVAESIDWRLVSETGIEAGELFDQDPWTQQLSSSEIDALVSSIDDCRGAGDVVLAIFRSQGQMEELQIGCFASQMSPQSARDLLRLIIADDEKTFVGSEGEILLGVCGQGVSG